jgi:hypothetical protein
VAVSNEAVGSEVDSAAIARKMWLLFETYHDVMYFTPESRAAADAVGCKGGWMGYFGMRAAPLGAASPELVTSTFFTFHRSLVHRAIPDAWQIAEPARFLDARLSGADGALRRMLGADVVASDDMAEAAALITRAAALAPTAGRPLGAANAAVAVPEEPHLALWWASTVLRESRGDGHIAALVAAQLDPCEALVLFAAEKGLNTLYVRKARGWSEEDWLAAQHRLVARGLVTEEGALTEDGVQLRSTVERQTDLGAATPWLAIGLDNTARVTTLLQPMALTLAERNDAMRINPMAVDAAKELAG